MHAAVPRRRRPVRALAGLAAATLACAGCHPFESTDDYPYPDTAEDSADGIDPGDTVEPPDGTGDQSDGSDDVDPGDGIDTGDGIDPGDGTGDVLPSLSVDAGDDGIVVVGESTPIAATIMGLAPGDAYVFTWSGPPEVSFDNASLESTTFTLGARPMTAPVELVATVCRVDPADACASDTVAFALAQTPIYVDAEATVVPGDGSEATPFARLEDAIVEARTRRDTDGLRLEIRIAARTAALSAAEPLDRHGVDLTGGWDATTTPWSRGTGASIIKGPLLVQGARDNTGEDTTPGLLADLHVREGIPGVPLLAIDDSDVALDGVVLEPSAAVPVSLHIDGASTLGAERLQIFASQCSAARGDISNAVSCVDGVFVGGQSTVTLSAPLIEARSAGDAFAAGLTRLVTVAGDARLEVIGGFITAQSLGSVRAQTTTDTLIGLKVVERGHAELSNVTIDTGSGHVRPIAVEVAGASLNATGSLFTTGDIPALENDAGLAQALLALGGAEVTLTGGELRTRDPIATADSQPSRSVTAECQDCTLTMDGTKVFYGSTRHATGLRAVAARQVTLDEVEILTSVLAPPTDLTRLPSRHVGLQVVGGASSDIAASTFAPGDDLSCCVPGRFNVVVRGGRIEGGIARSSIGLESIDVAFDGQLQVGGHALLCVDGSSIAGGRAVGDGAFSAGVHASGQATWLHNAVIFGGSDARVSIGALLRGAQRSVGHTYIHGGDPNPIEGGSYGLVMAAPLDGPILSSVLNNIIHHGTSATGRAVVAPSAQPPMPYLGNALVDNTNTTGTEDCVERTGVDCSFVSFPTGALRVTAVASCQLDDPSLAREGTWALHGTCTELIATGSAVWASPECEHSCRAPLTERDGTPRLSDDVFMGSFLGDGEACEAIQVTGTPNSSTTSPDIGPDEL